MNAGQQYQTPPEIARELRVTVARVWKWIRAGELDAVNVSDGRQPRFRVSREALAAFLQARRPQPPTARAKRRRAAAAAVEKFF